MKKFDLAFNKKANIAYIVAGYPSLENTREILSNLDNSKIDILEIGIPYSDPISDGKIIEQAAQYTCNKGVNTDDIFNLLDEFEHSLGKPLVFLVYYNLIFNYGIDNFIKRAKKCGISGIIIPDLPYEENFKLSKKLKEAKISLIPLVSITSKKRIKKLVKNATGFIYAVGVVGITGGKTASLGELKALIGKIKKYTTKPIAIGFGIKTRKDIKQIKKISDGAIVGTKIVQICKKNPENTIQKINELFR